MKKIILFTQYNTILSGRNVVSPIAGVTYTDYIIDCLKRSGYYVTIVSVSGGDGYSYFLSHIQNVDNMENIIYLPTINQKGAKIRLRLSQLFMYFQIIRYIIFHTRHHDKFLIYHDVGLSWLFHIIKRIFHRSYYYIVGEVFAAVDSLSKEKIESEISLLANAKGYIFINNILPTYFGKNVNYAVAHGNYLLENNPDINRSDTINIVYAGKIDSKVITDAFTAAECAKYLDEKYHIYILGYGSDNDIVLLENLINSINKHKGFNIVSYNGCLKGDEYIAFLRKCHIGLCTRTLAEPYNDYCFPSKTVIYIKNGLITICPSTSSLRNSDLARFMNFIDGEMDPSKIANVIKSSVVNNNIFEITKYFSILDSKFLTSLNNVFN